MNNRIARFYRPRRDPLQDPRWIRVSGLMQRKMMEGLQPDWVDYLALSVIIAILGIPGILGVAFLVMSS